MLPIRCRSHFSPGHGASPVPELLDAAVRAGAPAVMLADRESLAGQPMLHALARERGVRALTAVDVAAPGGERVIALARNDSGYRAICRWLSRRSLAAPDGPAAVGLFGPVSDAWQALMRSGGDVLWLVGEPAVARAMLDRHGADPAHVRVLLTRPTLHPDRERALVELARARGLETVADVYANVARREEGLLLRLLSTLLNDGTPADGATAPRPRARAVPSVRVLEDLFADAPAAVRGAARLMDECELVLEPRAPELPTTSVPAGLSPSAWLRRLTTEALRSASPDGRRLGPAYEERLERELGIVEQTGMAEYFLVVREVASLARRMDVPLATRGSAAASLVLHLLGASEVDPVAADLLFERFLNRRRRDLPDVDIEVCSARRDAFLDAVFEHFGRDRVAHVGAHRTLGRRTIASAAPRALGCDPQEARSIRERLPPDEVLLEMEEPAWRQALHAVLRGTALEGRADLLARAVGAPAGVSAHSAGVVVTRRPLTDLAPLVRAGTGRAMLQYDLRAARWMGMVKVDILGNRALTQIHRTLAAVRASCGDERAARLARCDRRDPATLDRLRAGLTIGCSQIETPPVRSVLRALPVEGDLDLMAALALVRPGPASGAARERFLRRAADVEPDAPVHPALAGALRASRGLLLYEDDIVRAIAGATGVDLATADRVRSVIVASAADPGRMARLEARFLTLAVASGSGSAAEARALWAEIGRFAQYSFNKAHAASCAVLAYRCTFLRTHAPEEFACAVLDEYGGAYPLRSVAAAFVREGIEVRAPHVTHSGRDSLVERDETGSGVRLGLRHVRGLGREACARLLGEAARRPFRHVHDLVARVPLERAALEALVLSGALDGVPPLDRGLYPGPHVRLLGLATTGRSSPGEATAGAAQAPIDAEAETDEEHRNGQRSLASALLRVRNELRFLAMHPSVHPMALLRPRARECGARSALDLHRCDGGTRVRFVGILAAARRVAPGAPETARHLSLEDETGMLEATLPRRVEARVRDRMTTPGPYALDGLLIEEAGGMRLLVEELAPFHRRPGTARGRSADPIGRDRARRPSRGSSGQLRLELP